MVGACNLVSLQDEEWDLFLIEFFGSYPRPWGLSVEKALGCLFWAYHAELAEVTGRTSDLFPDYGVAGEVYCQRVEPSLGGGCPTTWEYVFPLDGC